MKNFNKNIENKRGVTLIILVITVIIMLILLSIITINTKSSIDKSKLVSFAEEVNNISEASKAYYILNKEIPKLDDSQEYTFKDLMDSKTENVEKLDLKNDIYFNHDEDSKFYKLDLSKINVEKIARGTGKYGEADRYYVSYPNLNAYYIKGIVVNKINYYSLTSKITELNILEQDINDLSSTDVITTANINVTKIKSKTTNLNVNITVNMDNDESLYMSVCSEPSLANNKKIVTSFGKNNFHFDKISDILNGKSNIKIEGTNNLTLDDVEMIEGKYLGNGVYGEEGRVSDRYIYLSKYNKDGILVAKVKVDLNNYANISPKIVSSSIDELDNINIYNLSLKEGDENIQEVRYEYVKKLDENIGVVNYYEGKEDIDLNYILKNGKKAEAIGNNTSIKTGKNIVQIKVLVVDKAGNYVAKDMKISRFNPGSETSNPSYWNNEDLKAVYAKDSEGVIGNKNSLVIIPVPKGFVLSSVEGENDISKGAVIYQGTEPVTNRNDIEAMKTRNQYVWVPVDGDKIKYGRYDWKEGKAPAGDINTENLIERYLPGFKEAEVKERVEKYKGFYIGRYEVGKDSKVSSDGNSKDELVIQIGKNVYNEISFYDANLRAIYEVLRLKNVNAGIITGAQWDTALKFIQKYGIKDVEYPTYSVNKGNYNNVRNPLKTGCERKYKFNNIYDMAGNAWEFTNELASDKNYSIIRGGSYNDYFSAGTRAANLINGANAVTSFRISLYMK